MGCLPRAGGRAAPACVAGRGLGGGIGVPSTPVFWPGSAQPLSKMGDALNSRPVTSMENELRGDAGGPSAGGSTPGHKS